MSEYEYKYLTVQERLSMIAPRLEVAERQLYEAKLNMQTQPNYDESSLDQIQAKIEWLESEYKSLSQDQRTD